MKTELFSEVRDSESLLEYLKCSPVLEYLGGESLLVGDGGHVGSVLSRHMEALVKTSKVWKKERTGLLLL